MVMNNVVVSGVKRESNTKSAGREDLVNLCEYNYVSTGKHRQIKASGIYQFEVF